MDIEQIQRLCKDIEKKSGKGSIFTTGKETRLNIPRWSSQIEALDNIIGGGIPKGRVIEIYGPESSGKTSLVYWLMSLHKLGLYIPIEGTYDEDRAMSIGVKKKQMLVYRANYGEEALNAVIKFAKTGIPIICIDSVPACQPKEDIDKLEKDVSNEARIGGVARLFSRALPAIVHICEETGTTLILVNQVRDKMNAMLFGEKEDTPGGRAIKFYSSVRIKVARRAWIEIPNKNPAVSSDSEKVGIIMKAKVSKSKVSNPYGEAELPFFFDRGFVGYEDIKPIRSELMKKRKEEYGV
jgi:recombination protein RecA|nr:MAG TPA: Protein recA [Caudoviricetes sp.]